MLGSSVDLSIYKKMQNAPFYRTRGKVVNVIGLTIDNEPENNEPQEKKDDDTENNNNENKDIEILPTKFDYQGNKEAELKYGQSMKSTTEYIKFVLEPAVAFKMSLN